MKNADEFIKQVKIDEFLLNELTNEKLAGGHMDQGDSFDNPPPWHLKAD